MTLFFRNFTLQSLKILMVKIELVEIARLFVHNFGKYLSIIELEEVLGRNYAISVKFLIN